jgi:nitrogenase molybdenum-iron protein alpha/beta subunit
MEALFMDNRHWENSCTHMNACALTGAAAFFAGIGDAIMVDNGPLWCYFYALRYLEKSCPSVRSRFFCSQPDNHAIVYGSEECLLEILATVKEMCQPAVLLIENSCSLGLIGDDLAGIAHQANLSCPVLCLDSGGLIGEYGDGYRAASKLYFESLPLKPRDVVLPHTVNLLGCTVGYYNAENDLQELKRLLTLAGFDVLACPGAGSNVAEIAGMTQAELNLVVHDELGLELAKQLKQEYGMPYLSLLPPYGLDGTQNWLKKIAQALWVNEINLTAVKKEIEHTQQFLQNRILELQQLWGDLWYEKTVLVAPVSIAVGLAKALRSEWLDTDQVIIKLTDGDLSEKIPAEIDEVFLSGESGADVAKHLTGLTTGLLLASSNEKALLQRQGVKNIVCHNITLPVYDEVILGGQPFMGVRGTAYMLEQLWNRYTAFCQRDL